MQTTTDVLYTWGCVIGKQKHLYLKATQTNFHTHHNVDVQCHWLRLFLMDNLRFHHKLLKLECISQTLDRPIHLGNIYENDEDCFLWRRKKKFTGHMISGASSF